VFGTLDIGLRMVSKDNKNDAGDKKQEATAANRFLQSQGILCALAERSNHFF